MLRDMVRRLGPIAWRDARLAELQAKVNDQRELIADLRTRLAAPPPPPPPPRYRPTVASWHTRVMEQQRVQRAVNELDGSAAHPRRNLFRKLHNYEVARSHGVATPRVLGVWQQLTDIAWDELPERFVLKSDGGSSGRGVLPLERHGDRFRLVDGTAEYTAEEIVAHYVTVGSGARPPYFAEELLEGTAERLPDDVKIYVFHGEVGYVMIRRMPVHADTSRGRVRVVTADGADLGTVQRGRTSDSEVPVPVQLAAMVQTAVALSLAVPLPYIRVDLYAAGDDGVVLGELTPLPGDSQTFTRTWDRRLGEMYDRAEARLQVELAAGRPYGVLYGPHGRDLTGPATPTTTAPDRPDWRS